MIKNMQHIYTALQDEESKYIFRQRLLYSITDDEQYMDTILQTILLEGRFGLKGLSSFIEKYKEAPKRALLFGAGLFWPPIYSALRKANIPIEGICDSHVKTLPTEFADIPLIIGKDMEENIHGAYIILTPYFPHSYQSIFTQLMEKGLNRADIFIASMHSAQYFDRDIMKPQPNEVFIDAGAYTGDTLELFLDFCKGEYAEIYGFEPNPNVQEGLEKTLKRLAPHDTEIFQRGAWNGETTLHFEIDPVNGSHVQDGGDIEIKTKAIDSIQAKHPITLIKMDIEGAEMEALRGAANTIQRDKPRLAICVYHKPEDILDIPNYILSLHPDYKLYLRHYSYMASETVLYAL